MGALRDQDAVNIRERGGWRKQKPVGYAGALQAR
jgi:hypothetical protein